MLSNQCNIKTYFFVSLASCVCAQDIESKPKSFYIIPAFLVPCGPLKQPKGKEKATKSTKSPVFAHYFGFDIVFGVNRGYFWYILDYIIPYIAFGTLPGAPEELEMPKTAKTTLKRPKTMEPSDNIVVWDPNLGEWVIPTADPTQLAHYGRRGGAGALDKEPIIAENTPMAHQGRGYYTATDFENELDKEMDLTPNQRGVPCN